MQVNTLEDMLVVLQDPELDHIQVNLQHNTVSYILETM